MKKPEQKKWRQNPDPKWALIGLVVLAFTWILLFTFKTKPHRAPEKSTPQKTNFESLSESKPKVKPETAQATPTSESSIVKPNAKVEIEAGDDEDCWSRIDAQLGPNRFIETKKDQLRGEFPAWILQKDAHWDQPSAVQDSSSGLLTALGYAGLLDGRKPPLNEEKAIKFLTNMSNDEPENSALLVYLAIIYDRQGKKDEVAKLIEKIRKTTVFDSGLTGAARLIYEKVETPEDLLGAVGLASALPIPQYEPLKAFVLKNQLDNVAEQMIEANYVENPRGDFVDAVAIEYGVGQYLLKKLNKPSKRPDTKTYLKKLMSTGPFGGAEIEAEIRKACDIRALEPAVESLKKYLATHPRKPSIRGFGGTKAH